MKPMFRFLADPDQLWECVHGNIKKKKSECVPEFAHLEAWAQDNIFIIYGFQTCYIYDAVIVFNDENVRRVTFLQRLSFRDGAFILLIITETDCHRGARVDKTRVCIRYTSLLKNCAYSWLVSKVNIYTTNRLNFLSFVLIIKYILHDWAYCFNFILSLCRTFEYFICLPPTLVFAKIQPNQLQNLVKYLELHHGTTI